PSPPGHAAPAPPIRHQPGQRGSSGHDHGSSSPAKRMWNSRPRQGRQARRPLAVGKAWTPPRYQGSPCYLRHHAVSDQIDTVTPGSPRPGTLYQQALRPVPSSADSHRAPGTQGTRPPHERQGSAQVELVSPHPKAETTHVLFNNCYRNYAQVNAGQLADL